MSRTNKLPPFVALYRDLLRDQKWRSLSSSAKVSYIYLRSKFNTSTFSEVTLTFTEMKDLMSSQTFSNSLKELQEAGFIEKSKIGGLYGGCTKYKFIGKFKDFHYKGYKV